MKGLLVRVGIDSTAGHWNAPVDPFTRRFVFVPIPEEHHVIRKGCERLYEEVRGPLHSFGQDLPRHLRNRRMHLDPDFTHLTYGDIHPRNLPIRKMGEGDFIVFYAGLRSIHSTDQELVYAIIGFYSICEVVRSGDVHKEQWHENAHTRRADSEDDLIVRAEPGRSGRLAQCLAIGEYRARAYRVRQDLLNAWDGLSVKDGYIQRSGRLPGFLMPEKFIKWFNDQHPVFVRRYF